MNMFSEPAAISSKNLDAVAEPAAEPLNQDLMHFKEFGDFGDGVVEVDNG